MASQPTPQLSIDLRRLIQRNPNAPVHLLLRVTGVTEQAEAAIVAAGFEIRRRLTLVPIFAVTGPVSGVLDLLAEPWLLNAELDRPVHTH